MEEAKIANLFSPTIDKNNNEIQNESTLPIDEKQELKSSISKLKTQAEIFGLSASELENEFLDYKVDKLLKRIDYLVEDTVAEVSLREKVAAARKLGFGSVTVFPTRVEFAKRLIGTLNVGVNVIINYPFGEELSSVKYSAVKSVAKLPISSISTPITPLMLGFYRIKTTEKELKKMKKLSSKKTLKVVINLEDFSQSQLGSLTKLLHECKIETVCAKGVSDENVQKLKALIAFCSGKLVVEVWGEVSLKTCATMFTLGVSKVSLINAEKIADELKDNIKH